MPNRRYHGWVLRTPRGKLVAETFVATTDKEEACGPAYSYLNAATKWANKYWHKWDESIEAARKRGYVLVKAQLKLVK